MNGFQGMGQEVLSRVDSWSGCSIKSTQTFKSNEHCEFACLFWRLSR